MSFKKGVSLLELLIVTIIIGILAALSLPLFERTRERALDNEAKANLKLIQAAQRIYQMEVGFFLDCAGLGGASCINTYLRLSLPAGLRSIWSYDTTAVGTDEFLGIAQRNTPNASWLRSWSINATAEEARCSGNGCP
ncbi:MAG: type II secretion system GspH family protein [Candidatus Omnitrophica bacterium]|nr:type II secretion system GspH family protein [Candidatus Omnitrophota bacterium]